MSTKTYSVRMPLSTPEVSGDEVAVWLDNQLASNAALVADPGAGDRTLRLSLDSEKVKAGAKAASEAEAAAFLRRLIASNKYIPEEPDDQEAKPKTPLLRGAQRLRPETVMPVIRLWETGQSYVIRKALKASEATREAALTDEERQLLATSTSEVVNRRAPQWVVENVDYIGLALTVVAIGWKKIDAVETVAERKRLQHREQLQKQESGQ